MSDAGTGILLVHLGSPAAPTPRAVRKFLDEFLGDPMVVDLNPLLWWLVRKGIVLPIRSRRSAALYRSIWTAEGSPLACFSERIRAALDERLARPVALSMRYGQPSIAAAIAELRRRGARRLRLLSLFPQASRTTTGSIEREVRRVLARLADAPELEVVPPWYAHPGYVAALAACVREATEGKPVEHFVFSLHGLPVRYETQYGDPYREHCEATARALADELELARDAWTLAYQSRFGREPWLEPDTAEVVPDLARSKARVAIVCPGFVTDCLETLEEIALRLPRAFREAGGEELVVVPCLNDHPLAIDALVDLLGS